GEIVESGTAMDIFKDPRHPYTVGLMASVPRLDATEKVRLATIEGQPPLLIDEIQGCPFLPRCDWAIDTCAVDPPELEEKVPGHMARCHRNPQVDAPTRADSTVAAAS